MPNISIMVPVDFTSASEKAVLQAISIAQSLSAKIDLFHVIDEYSESESKRLLDIQVEKVKAAGLTVQGVLTRGSVIPSIIDQVKKGAYHFMVVGTHGPRGLRQLLFGADILKILKANPCPAIVVQKDADPHRVFRKILLPVGLHENYNDLMRATCILALAFEAEVTLLSISTGTNDIRVGLASNMNNTKDFFDQFDVHYTEAHEIFSKDVSAIAGETLKFGELGKFDLIAMMPNAGKDDFYFRDGDKEKVLTNESNIPILCSKG
jgi:nucleotide-binding universal stress UspA family protein